MVRDIANAHEGDKKCIIYHRKQAGTRCFRCLFSRENRNDIDKCEASVTMSSIHRGVAQPGLACLTGGQKVGGSNPLAPTFLEA